MELSNRFDEALVYAHGLHRAQKRKGTEIPYVAHLIGVASIAIEHGGDEDQAIAALLHDAPEDQGGKATLEEIRRRFGDGVAAIVADCTDAWTEPKPPWIKRKQDYVAALGSKPLRSMLVSLADKTYNAEAIATDYETLGEAVFARFSTDAAGVRWYYGALGEVFRQRMSGPLATRYTNAVKRFAAAP